MMNARTSTAGGLAGLSTDLSTGFRSRRDFLRLAALGGAAVMLPSMLTACNDGLLDPAATATFNFASETGAVNLAWAMEQVQLNFYQRVTSYVTYSGITSLEFASIFSVTSGIASHHQGHINVFRTLVESGRGIPPNLNIDFPGVNFSSRADVFALAIKLKDISIPMYNGLIAYATSLKWQSLFAKMASVEARHLATIRDLADIFNGQSDTAARTSFAGDDEVSPTTGLDKVATPQETFTALQQYITTDLTLRGI